MAIVTSSTTIQRPVEDVFAVMSNPANDHRWSSAVVEAELTSPGPVGVGTTAHYVGKTLGRRYEAEWDHRVRAKPQTRSEESRDTRGCCARHVDVRACRRRHPRHRRLRRRTAWPLEVGPAPLGVVRDETMATSSADPEGPHGS